MRFEVHYRLLMGFDDPEITPELWNDLVHQGSTDEIFLTWQWQKAWWEAFGRGELLLIMAERNGKPLCIAPLFADQGMVFFTGSGGSDYLDFIGKIETSDILENMLGKAMKLTTDFAGFLFYHIPEFSETHHLLADLALKRKWYFCEEGELVSPRMEISVFPEKAGQSIRKKSLLRHEAWFSRNGEILINHFHRKDEVIPLLNIFFRQHIDRWAVTPFPSLFLKNEECLFYSCLTDLISDTGWLRFTTVEWNGKPVAFHFGFNYMGIFLWYKPSFDITLAKYSPGEVLLRHLLIKAVEENAHTFDFGLGDEDFKRRFSTSEIKVKNFGLYPENFL